MATERITIVVSQTGAVSVKKDIADIGPAANSSATAVDSLKSALAAYIGLQAAQKVGELADAGTRLTNTLRQAGLSGQGLVDEQQKLFDLATANGQSVNELAGIFQKLTAVQGQLGASGKDVDKALTGVAASMKLSTSNAEAQRGSLIQLSQLFGGVNVQAQEYNSLIDGAYPLLQAVARGSDRFGGSVAALTQAVKASSVTTKEFFAALVKGSDANIALAQSFNLTIGQSLTNFNTKLIELVLKINTATGAFNGVSIAINFVATNLGTILAILSPLIAGLTLLAVEIIGGYLVTATLAANAALGNMILTLGRLTLALLANPFTAFLAAVVLVIAYLVDWQKALQTVIQLYGALKYAIDSALGASTEQLKADVKIVLDAKQAAADIVASGQKVAALVTGGMNSGGANASKSLTNGMVAGGQAAAQILKAGTEEYSKAVYESLNGVPQKLLGAIQTGADYTYNQITGAVEASIPTAGITAGSSMQSAIVAGGNTAASTIGAAISSASREATIAATQAAQSLAQSYSGRNSIDQGLGFIPGGSASGSGGPIYTGKRGGNLSQAIQDSIGSGRVNGDGQPKSSHYVGETVSQVQGAGGITIKNYTAPTDALQAIDTNAGNKTIVNVIKGNASEIKALLGIV
jgi:tape measure domain-containing protein